MLQEEIDLGIVMQHVVSHLKKHPHHQGRITSAMEGAVKDIVREYKDLYANMECALALTLSWKLKDKNLNSIKQVIARNKRKLCLKWDWLLGDKWEENTHNKWED